MIPLAVFEAIIDASGVAPRIEALLPAGVRPRQLSGPHPAGRHVPGPGRSPARPPDPRAPGPDQPARRRPAAARRDRGLEARAAPADLPADRVHLRPGRGRRRQGRTGRAALRPAAGHLRRPARGIGPGPVQGRQHLAGGGLDGPGLLLPAPAARHQRLRRPRSILGPPQEQPAAQPGRAVLRVLPVRRDHDARGERARRPRARPPRHGLVVPARPGPRVRPRADRAARPADPARRHPRRLRLRAPRRRRLGTAAAARPGRSSSRTCTRTTAAPRAPTTAPSSPTATSTARAHPAPCWNSGRWPAPPPKSRPRTTTARPPSWPATSSAASPPTTPTATTASPAPPPWARSAARCGPSSMTLDRGPARDPHPAGAPPGLLHPADHHRPAGRDRQDRAETRLPLRGLAPLLRPPHRRRTRLRHRQGPRQQRHQPAAGAASWA